jgi:hypothetical protein
MPTNLQVWLTKKQEATAAATAAAEAAAATAAAASAAAAAAKALAGVVSAAAAAAADVVSAVVAGTGGAGAADIIAGAAAAAGIIATAADLANAAAAVAAADDAAAAKTTKATAIAAAAATMAEVTVCEFNLRGYLRSCGVPYARALQLLEADQEQAISDFAADCHERSYSRPDLIELVPDAQIEAYDKGLRYYFAVRPLSLKRYLAASVTHLKLMRSNAPLGFYGWEERRAQ